MSIRPLFIYQERIKKESREVLDVWSKAIQITAVLDNMDEKLHGSPYWREWFDQLRTLVPPGIYELHKSTRENQKFYTVFGVNQHSEDRTQLFVAYSARYAPYQGLLLNRPLLGKGGFLTPVYKGASATHHLWVPRFRRTGLLNPSFENFLEQQ